MQALATQLQTRPRTRPYPRLISGMTLAECKVGMSVIAIRPFYTFLGGKIAPLQKGWITSVSPTGISVDFGPASPRVVPNTDNLRPSHHSEAKRALDALQARVNHAILNLQLSPSPVTKSAVVDMAQIAGEAQARYAKGGF